MGDENPIRTLGDYSKPSHKVYRNTVGLPSEDPNQHLKDFLKPVDSLDFDDENKERMRMTVKLRNDILMFQQHHGESLSEAWTRPSSQPQALGTTFEARVRDYMAAHTKRMERFKNTIFRQRKEINGRMTEMFGLLKELTTSRTPKKVLIKEEAKFPVTKNVNFISLTKGEEEGSNRMKVTPDNAKKLTETETKTPVMEHVAYYLKHKINEKLIKGLVNNNRFNNSRSRTQAGKKNGKEHKVLPGGPAYDAILKKKITKKEDIRGNFEIPCSIRNLKHVNALVYQGSDMKVMPYSIYMKLTDKRPAKTDIRLSLASHSYIYPLGIAEDMLVEISEHVNPVDFVILGIRENENRPSVLGTPFLTIAKASIKFNTSTITLRSRKHKVSFHRTLDSSNVTDKGVKMT
ncbi:MAK10-like protein [Tanacetum coccineum]